MPNATGQLVAGAAVLAKCRRSLPRERGPLRADSNPCAWFAVKSKRPAGACGRSWRTWEGEKTTGSAFFSPTSAAHPQSLLTHGRAPTAWPSPTDERPFYLFGRCPRTSCRESGSCSSSFPTLSPPLSSAN